MVDTNVAFLHIYGDKAIFYYFFITKTLDLSNDKWESGCLAQYSPRKTKGSI